MFICTLLTCNIIGDIIDFPHSYFVPPYVRIATIINQNTMDIGGVLTFFSFVAFSSLYSYCDNFLSIF
jgi:hypothetical protein